MCFLVVRTGPCTVLVKVGNGQSQNIDLDHHHRLDEITIDGVSLPGTTGFDFETAPISRS